MQYKKNKIEREGGRDQMVLFSFSFLHKKVSVSLNEEQRRSCLEKYCRKFRLYQKNQFQFLLYDY